MLSPEERIKMVRLLKCNNMIAITLCTHIGDIKNWNIWDYVL